MTHKAFLLAGFIFLSTGIIYAQVNYKPGYIIQANRDTIWGEIAYRGDVMMSQECRFREKSGAEARYSPSEIAGYRFDDGKYFVSRRFNGEDIFLEFLIKGKVSIFYFRDNYTDRYLIEKEGDSLVELPYEETLKYDRDKQYLQKSTKHIRLLQFYMSDAPGLQSRIDDIEKPGHGNLIKLATDYHYAVCDDEECLIYAKKTSSFKCNIEISAGYRKFRDTGESFFPMGVLAHIWLPRSNEKLYVKTGSVYSKFRTLKKFEYKYYDYNGDPQTKLYMEEAIVRGAIVPVQIEYQAPKGIIRPKAAAGMSFYFPGFDKYVSLSAGVNIRIMPKTYLSANYDLDFMPSHIIIVIPDRLASHAVTGGLYFDL